MPAAGQAAQLQVSPVSIEVQAPGAAATLQLRNVGPNALNAQIRVFRWIQVNGEEKLEPTDEVVASPPLAVLAPQSEYTVRLVRVTKQPLSRGESYRLLVDELPDPTAQRNRSVSLILRYSIPAFFYPAAAADARVSWSFEQRGERIHVSATNVGDRHLRVAGLKVRLGNGEIVSFGNGLAGYVHGRSTITWNAPVRPSQLFASGSVEIVAQSDRGPIDAVATAQRLR